MGYNISYPRFPLGITILFKSFEIGVGNNIIECRSLLGMIMLYESLLGINNGDISLFGINKDDRSLFGIKRYVKSSSGIIK